MKILFLLTQDIESPSGMGRYFPIARELVRLGHQVTIAALHSNYAALEETRFQKDGVDIWYVAQMHVLKQGNRKLYYLPSQLLIRIIQATTALTLAALRTPADIVHIAKPHPMNGVAGLTAKFLHRRACFVDCDDYEAGSGNFSSRWQKQVITFFEKRVPRLAKVVTTNTHFMRSKLIDWGIAEEQILYLPNGLDIDRFHAPDHKEVETLRAELNLQDKNIIAYIGSVSLANHPVNLLLDAFVHIHATVTNTVLLLVGGGEDYDLLQYQAQKLSLGSAIRFQGRVAPEKVRLYYRLADISVDPVYDDTAAKGRSPIKLFESWASQVPFVTADVGDRRFLLGSPPAGLLAQPGDSISLAECILQILQNRELADELQKRGLERVKQFTWDRMIRNLEKAYLESIQA